jgi:hypothetical protein
VCFLISLFESRIIQRGFLVMYKSTSRFLLSHPELRRGGPLPKVRLNKPSRFKCQRCCKSVARMNADKHLKTCRGRALTNKGAKRTPVKVICPKCKRKVSSINIKLHLKNVHQTLLPKAGKSNPLKKSMEPHESAVPKRQNTSLAKNHIKGGDGTDRNIKLHLRNVHKTLLPKDGKSNQYIGKGFSEAALAYGKVFAAYKVMVNESTPDSFDAEVFWDGGYTTKVSAKGIVTDSLNAQARRQVTSTFGGYNKTGRPTWETDSLAVKAWASLEILIRAGIRSQFELDAANEASGSLEATLRNCVVLGRVAGFARKVAKAYGLRAKTVVKTGFVAFAANKGELAELHAKVAIAKLADESVKVSTFYDFSTGTLKARPVKKSMDPHESAVPKRQNTSLAKNHIKGGDGTDRRFLIRPLKPASQTPQKQEMNETGHDLGRHK